MVSRTITLLYAGLPLIHAAAPSIPGFTLTWSDDFIGSVNSLPNTANWIIDTGTSYAGGPANWGTGEIQTYTSRPANVKLTGDGTLQITPIRDANNQWTSGRIETKRSNFQAVDGGKMRISARVAMPDVTGQAALGYWPAFWSLGENFRSNNQAWPAVGEYDIMENVNGINRVWGVLHCGVDPGGPCKETDGLPGNITCPGAPCQGNWHVYSIEVDRSSTPEKLTWSVDGINFHTVTENDLPAATWAQTVHHGHFLLLNLAIGGAFPNKNLGSATPLSTTVSEVPLYADWVAVYNSV